jgi:predicted ATPase
MIVLDPCLEIETNLADIGFGASQTLPIIVESFYASPGSLILVEQPEIHLHPKVHSTFGDLFIKAVNENIRTFIIETHSEHILARVRRRIAEGRIDKNKVAIYYFERGKDGTNIREVILNMEGFSVGTWDNFRADLAMAFKQPHDRNLPRGPSPFDLRFAFLPMHIPRFPTDIGFIHFDLPGKLF